MYVSGVVMIGGMSSLLCPLTVASVAAQFEERSTIRVNNCENISCVGLINAD